MIHKVDSKLVSRNGKKASSFVVPLQTPGQGQRITTARQGFGSQEDLFEDREQYFEQATPYGDTLYTPAPLIGWFTDTFRNTLDWTRAHFAWVDSLAIAAVLLIGILLR